MECFIIDRDPQYLVRLGTELARWRRDVQFRYFLDVESARKELKPMTNLIVIEESLLPLWQSCGGKQPWIPLVVDSDRPGILRAQPLFALCQAIFFALFSSSSSAEKEIQALQAETFELSEDKEGETSIMKTTGKEETPTVKTAEFFPRAIEKLEKAASEKTTSIELHQGGVYDENKVKKKPTLIHLTRWNQPEVRGRTIAKTLAQRSLRTLYLLFDVESSQQESAHRWKEIHRHDMTQFLRTFCRYSLETSLLRSMRQEEENLWVVEGVASPFDLQILSEERCEEMLNALREEDFDVLILERPFIPDAVWTWLYKRCDLQIFSLGEENESFSLFPKLVLGEDAQVLKKAIFYVVPEDSHEKYANYENTAQHQYVYEDSPQWATRMVEQCFALPEAPSICLLRLPWRESFIEKGRSVPTHEDEEIVEKREASEEQERVLAKRGDGADTVSQEKRRACLLERLRLSLHSLKPRAENVTKKLDEDESKAVVAISSQEKSKAPAGSSS